MHCTKERAPVLDSIAPFFHPASESIFSLWFYSGRSRKPIAKPNLNSQLCSPLHVSAPRCIFCSACKNIVKPHSNSVWYSNKAILCTCHTYEKRVSKNDFETCPLDDAFVQHMRNSTLSQRFIVFHPPKHFGFRPRSPRCSKSVSFCPKMSLGVCVVVRCPATVCLRRGNMRPKVRLQLTAADFGAQLRRGAE